MRSLLAMVRLSQARVIFLFYTLGKITIFEISFYIRCYRKFIGNRRKSKECRNWAKI